MHAAGHAYNLMSASEVDCIHAAALRILDHLGLEIQNQEILAGLAADGARVDFSAQRATFSPARVESFLAGAEKHDWQTAQPWVGGSAGVYHGRFHDPISNDLVPWDERNLAFYFALAGRQDHLSGASMLGSRLMSAGTPAALEALYERYYAWKFGASEGGGIYVDEICPALYELYQLRASQLGKPLAEVFQASVYLIPACKLGRHEAYQLQWFRQKGLRVGAGDMLAMGATSPVTLAGSVALNTAEQIALGLFNHALFGDNQLRLGGSISVMDMRSMIYPYGRPEMALANLMIAQMARFYGASYSGHAGLSDAKLPSVEAGYQKALTAIPTLLACGSLWMDAGLLSIDEVCSPVQLILDNEFLSALSRFTHEFEISAESIGLEDILALGPGGSYLDRDHTARRFRQEHWRPSIWSQEMLNPWLAGPRQSDIERAREQAAALYSSFQPESHLSSQHEAEILALIARACRALSA
jgi:trimethylamine:corrinoid methyltransferase-like protein